MAALTHSHPAPSPPCLSFTTAQVRNELRKIKAKKAAGPDGISARLLKSCGDQLCGVLEHMFSMSLKLGRVPQLWKTSCVVPVPKTQHPKDLNSYRPVALTSHLMKSLGRLVLTHHPPPLVNIQGMDVERVDSYKHLGVHLNNKLDWSVNTTALHKKGQSRLYLLRRLRSCGVQGALLRPFLDTVVASAIFYRVVCWGSSISTTDR
ncbi:hypothetical protein NFI96_009751 [Prochilodus magdalenae]|nr:hypothetical protein NFI96_009751 [Prochilodus magdalenae]